MSRDQHPVAVVRRAGGIVDAGALRTLCTARSIRRSIEVGEIVVLRRGTFGLASIYDTNRIAIELTGTISHSSAALAWGWAVKSPPTRPHLTVRRGRRFTPEQQTKAHLHRADELPPARPNKQGILITDPVSTVIACARALPYDEALAIADSALKSRRVTRAALLAAAEGSPRTGRQRAMAVARAADRRAANPFESCLRAICHAVDGLLVEPQFHIGPYRVDLADQRLQIVIEADSRTWHAGPDEHNADIRRYTTLVRHGWTVVRFSYADVMDDPAYVMAVLADVVALARHRS